MTDRELLEKAAIAAGIETLWDETLSRLYIIDGEHVQGEFKPLTDDGDALRLLVKLRMNLFVFAGEDSRAEAWIGEGANFCDEAERHNGGDLNAATRRAIVRAAAALADNVEFSGEGKRSLTDSAGTQG